MAILKHGKQGMLIWLVALFLGFASAPTICSAVPVESQPQKYALLIGIDDYKPSNIPPLKGSINDVRLVRDLLVQRFQFEPANIEMLTDSQATHTGIMAAFQRLTQKTKSGDFVYIHYSGHGSQARDENGDESARRGMDSTWVSYGSRSGDVPLPVAAAGQSARSRSRSKTPKAAPTAALRPKGLDGYDILDDELDSWLTGLGEKTDQIVFVSDSCHSGTITRGADAVPTRGVPTDGRSKHPAANLPPAKARISALSISASRDDEKASEYIAGSDYHGMFTWHWVRALSGARPDDTWEDLFKRTSTLVERSGRPQHPQAEGNSGRRLFGGDYPAKPKAIAVKSATGTRVMIDAGSLVGVTEGSVYLKYDPQVKKEALPRLEIVRTSPSWSEAKASGPFFTTGDLVVLEKYSSSSAPVKIFIRADLDDDLGIAENIREALAKLPALTMVDSQAQCDLVLQLLRPKKDAGGKYFYPQPTATLPTSFPGQPVECWVLTSDERLFQNQEQLKIPVDDQAGITLLADNIEKIARLKGALALSSAPGQEAGVELQTTIYSRVADTELPGNPAELTERDGALWRRGKTAAAGGPDTTPVRVGQRLEFSVHNKSDKPYYIYLVNIMQDGKILPFYPLREQSSEYALIQPGAVRPIEDVALHMDTPGKEYVRLIASLNPIDVYLLEQGSFRGRVGTKGALNPLEELLTARAGLTRGAGKSSLPASEWITVLGSFAVAP